MFKVQTIFCFYGIEGNKDNYIILTWNSIDILIQWKSDFLENDITKNIVLRNPTQHPTMMQNGLFQFIIFFALIASNVWKEN